MATARCVPTSYMAYGIVTEVPGAYIALTVVSRRYAMRTKDEILTDQ